MSKRTWIDPPADGDAHGAWDSYFQALLDRERNVSSSDSPRPSAATRFARHVLDRKARRLWFPGCGLDMAPRLYALLGLEVWASDTTPTAVGFQTALAEAPDERVWGWGAEIWSRYAQVDAPIPGGRLHARLHDFRTPFPEAEFDCVLNIRAFQILVGESLAAAARTHFTALRPGGEAFFDTQNVQGDERNVLEDALLAAGFFIPGYEAERWYRSALAATGIKFNFILGRPMCPFAQGEEEKAARERDQEVLESFRLEYEQRGERERAATESVRSDPATRTAIVIYNTG